MVGSPSNNRMKYNSLINKRPIRVISSGIGNVMGVSCRIRKVIFIMITMHPSGFKKAFINITCQYWRTIFVQNLNISWLLIKAIILGFSLAILGATAGLFSGGSVSFDTLLLCCKNPPQFHRSTYSVYHQHL